MSEYLNFSLEGKVALVTGASYGIGYAIASAYAKSGAKIVFCDIKQEFVDKGMAAYTADGIDAKGYVCDVTNEEMVQEMVKKIEVVTRYFGGTLLGTGGLVHTYGASAKQGLIESEIVIRKLCDIVSVKVDYSLLGKMQHEIMTKGYLLEDTIYEDEVTFIISCPIDTTDKVIAEIINMTNAGAVCEKIDKKYVDIKEEEG